MTDIRQLLMEVNPVPQVEVPDALRAELMAEVRRTPPPERRRRRLQWPIPSVLLGLVVAGGVATAGALYISERTRSQSAALTTSPAVVGEQGRPLAYGAEIRRFAERLEATTPYPPGMRETFNWNDYGQGTGAPGEISGSIELFVRFRAQCMWREYWLSSMARGREEAAREAAQILAQVPEWPGFRGTATRGDAQQRARRVAEAAAAKDVDTVKELTRGDCRDQP
jgi:hypothetical protein